MLLAFSIAATSQDIERQKAGWIYLLANNITWPGDPDEYIIKVVTDDRQLAGAIKEMTLKRQINEKPISVSFSNYVSVSTGVHILYVTEKYKGTLQEVINQVEDDPVLIITEMSTDERYLMINMVETPEGLSFQYNRANMVNQRLRLGPDFAGLGGEELDVATLYQQAKTSIQEIEEKANLVQGQVDTLNMLTAVAVKLGSTLLTRAEETEAQIDFQNKVLRDIRVVLRERENELQTVSADIVKKNKRISLGEVQLEAQEEEIARQEEAIARKSDELRGLELVIAYQSEILIFLIFFALLFLLALYLAYNAYKARRRDAKKLNEQRQELDELLDRLRMAQKQLIRAEKLASVGEISDSIAHDVNNASNYILSGYHIIRTRFEEYKQLMEKIRRLDADESDLKTKMKVKEIVELKQSIEYDTYLPIIVNMLKNIQVGVKRIERVLKGLEPYIEYGQLGRFGLTLLGQKKDDLAATNESSRRRKMAIKN